MNSDEDLKITLCHIMKELYADKILTDMGGNLSFRSIENKSFFWITPSGIRKKDVEPNHLIKMSMSGKVMDEGLNRIPSVEWPMHLKIFEEDEDFKVIVHSHAPLATAFSVLENPPKIPLLTAELSFLIPEIIIVPYKTSGSVELGKAVADALWDCPVVILENHGVVATGKTFNDALIKTRALEEYLQLYLNVKNFGGELRPFKGFD